MSVSVCARVSSEVVALFVVLFVHTRVCLFVVFALGVCVIVFAVVVVVVLFVVQTHLLCVRSREQNEVCLCVCVVFCVYV